MQKAVIMSFFLLLHLLVNPLLAENASQEISEESDPLEAPNRIIFFFNRIIDGLFIKPAAILYDQVMPNAVKKTVKNVKSNLGEISNTAYYALQGDGKRSMKSLGRFAVNTTVGIGGAMDVAQHIDLEPEETDMNETMIRWGATPGFYIMIPVLGPSSLRGTLSLATDTAGDPWYYITGNKKRIHNHHQQQRIPLYSTYLSNRLDQRSRYIGVTNEIQENIDPYVAMRTYYFQHQKHIEKKVRTR